MVSYVEVLCLEPHFLQGYSAGKENQGGIICISPLPRARFLQGYSDRSRRIMRISLLPRAPVFAGVLGQGRKNMIGL